MDKPLKNSLNNTGNIKQSTLYLKETNSMNIQINSVANINYILADDQSEEIDRAENGEFSYLQGANNIIPALENALANKQAGDKINITIPPADGYGEYDTSLVEVVPSEMFGEDAVLQIGGQFHAETPKGEKMVVTIKDIDGDKLTVDGNHALAGVTLVFDVEVVSVREATKEEVEHGHVHHEGGCGG